MGVMGRRSGAGGRMGSGWTLGLGAVAGAVAGWILTDLRKPGSTIKRWIEIGRSKSSESSESLSGGRESSEAAAVEEAIITDNQNRGQMPPDEMPV